MQNTKLIENIVFNYEKQFNPSRSWWGPPKFLLRETEPEAVHESGFGIVSYLSAEWNARFIPDKIKE